MTASAGTATRLPSTPSLPLDGIYIIRTPVPATALDAPTAVAAYKNLAFAERDFRHLRADDLDLRPIHHWLGDRARGHVLTVSAPWSLTRRQGANASALLPLFISTTE
jgi:hypothetical protein